MYRLVSIVVFVTILFIQPYMVSANVKEAYDEARLEYISALVSMATYSDYPGILAREGLADYGWFMRPYSEKFHGIETKFFLVTAVDFFPGQDTYMLAVTGTENMRDVKTDLTFSKVLFAGHTPTQFLAAAGTKHLTSVDPMVHRGFNKYANAAFFTKEVGDDETYGEYLAGLLAERPNRKLYLVGHSLGGAVATVAAARLISLGVDPRQLEVITFGAPAVGNSAFAAKFGKDINLKRVVVKGDPINGVLQSIAGGYTQFGSQAIRQKRLDIYRTEHAIGTYVDAATRNYYDQRRELEAAGYAAVDKQRTEPGREVIYFSTPAFSLTQELSPDEFYMREVAADSMRHNVDGFVIGAGERGSLTEELAKAEAAGCKWLAQGKFTFKKIPQQSHSYEVGYQEDIYDVKTGALKDTLVVLNSTKAITPLQSIVSNLAGIEEQRQQIVDKK